MMSCLFHVQSEQRVNPLLTQLDAALKEEAMESYVVSFSFLVSSVESEQSGNRSIPYMYCVCVYVMCRVSRAWC